MLACLTTAESYEYIYPSYMLHHDDYNSSAKVRVTRMPSSFGDYFVCNAYYPTDWTPGVDPALPAIVWLHPYRYNTRRAQSCVAAAPFAAMRAPT